MSSFIDVINDRIDHIVIVKQSLKDKLKFTFKQVNQIGIERAHRIKEKN